MACRRFRWFAQTIKRKVNSEIEGTQRSGHRGLGLDCREVDPCGTNACSKDIILDIVRKCQRSPASYN